MKDEVVLLTSICLIGRDLNPQGSNLQLIILPFFSKVFHRLIHLRNISNFISVVDHGDLGSVLYKEPT